MNIGLDNTKKTAQLLNEVLANEHVLYMKLRNFHWNVTGPHFSQYHEFFEEQYDKVGERIDEIAERIRMLDEFPVSTMKGYLEIATLKEEPTMLSAEKMISSLLADHEEIIRQMRDGIESLDGMRDFGNEDFLTALIEDHEKMAWMLRASK